MNRSFILPVLLLLMALQGKSQENSYYTQGYNYFKQQNFKEAVRWLTLSIKNEPGARCKSYRIRGVSKVLLQDHTGANKDIDSAFMICPDDADTWFSRGIVYYYEQKAEPAIKDFTKAIQLNPAKTDYYINRAQAYALKNDTANFKKDLYKAIETDPSGHQAYFNLGVYYKNTGQYQAAIKMLENAFQKTKNITVLVPLAFSKLKTNKYAEAAELCTTAIKNELAPERLSELYSIRGEAFVGLHEKEKACSDFNALLQFDAKSGKEHLDKYCK